MSNFYYFCIKWLLPILCLAVDILADEEEHLKDLEDFYQDITGETYRDEEENVSNLVFISKELLNNIYR